MGQGPRRRDDESDEYEDRHRGVDTSDAQQEVDEVIRRVQERFGEVDVDAEDDGRVAEGAAGGFGGGAAGGLAGSAVGGAIGREAGGRVGRRYAAGQVNSGPSSMTDVQGIGEGKAEALRDAGYESIEDIQDATRDELENVDVIGTAASGRLKDAASQADADTDARAVDPTVRESIEQTPFDSDEPTPTPQARRAVQRATTEAKQLFNSVAATFASRTWNQEVAQAMADQIEEGTFRKGVDPSFGPTAVGPNDTGDIILSEQVQGDSVYHELGHAVADAYGFARGWAGVQAEKEYERRYYGGESDPFIASDPTDREFLLTQENGVRIDDVPSEIETLIEETNRSWQRIQRRYQSGGEAETKNYTILDNYSSTSASEVFGQLNEAMQSDDPDLDRQNAKNNSNLIEAYYQIFVPSDVVRAFLDDIGIQIGGEQ